MRELSLAKRELSVGRKVQPVDDVERLVLDGDVVVRDEETGRAVVAQLHMSPGLLATTRQLVPKIRWDGTTPGSNEFRLSGIKNAHRTFGYSAPVPLRRRYGCNQCRLDVEMPGLAAALVMIARRISSAFAEVLPEEHEIHAKAAAQVDPSWRIGRGIFTSGIVNATAALPYHRDAGNMKGCWSGMIVLRSGIGGGRLHVPEYGVEMSVDDSSILLINGGQTLHGVTPLVPSPGGYRYSIVFYTKAQMVTCLAPEFEAKRAQIKRTESEDRQAAGH